MPTFSTKKYPCVAQAGSAAGLGPVGREFESLHTDHFTKEIQMKIDLNSIHLVSPKQNAEIVKMISDGTISGKQAKELLSIVINMNLKQIEEFLHENTKEESCCKAS